MSIKGRPGCYSSASIILQWEFLTHEGLKTMVAILQWIFSNPVSVVQIIAFWFNFHWTLFQWTQSLISQHHDLLLTCAMSITYTKCVGVHWNGFCRLLCLGHQKVDISPIDIFQSRNYHSDCDNFATMNISLYCATVLSPQRDFVLFICVFGHFKVELVVIDVRKLKSIFFKSFSFTYYLLTSTTLHYFVVDKLIEACAWLHFYLTHVIISCGCYATKMVLQHLIKTWLAGVKWTLGNGVKWHHTILSTKL